MSEKTTSEFMLEIASHYLMNGCDGCPFYDVTKTCDSKPINCTWMALRNYFKAEESKEESESAEPDRKKGEWIDGMPYVNSHWKVCSACHVSAPDSCGGFNFCPNCGADMRGGHGKA